MAVTGEEAPEVVVDVGLDPPVVSLEVVVAFPVAMAVVVVTALHLSLLPAGSRPVILKALPARGAVKLTSGIVRAKALKKVKKAMPRPGLVVLTPRTVEKLRDVPGMQAPAQLSNAVVAAVTFTKKA